MEFEGLYILCNDWMLGEIFNREIFVCKIYRISNNYWDLDIWDRNVFEKHLFQNLGIGIDFENIYFILGKLGLNLGVKTVTPRL